MRASAISRTMDPKYGKTVPPAQGRHAGPDAAALQSELLRGHLDAALAISPAASGELNAWAERRRSAIAEGRSRLRVGHTDLLLLPA